MSSRLFITIRTDKSNQEIDLEIPSDLKVKEIILDISKSLLSYAATNKNIEKLVLMTEEGNILPNEATLSQFSIQNFDILKLGFSDTLSTNLSGLKVDSSENCSETAANLEQISQSPMGDPYLEPFMVCNNRYIFILSDKAMIVGRKSKESTPDIDITEFDSGFVSSRKHISIIPRGGKHYCKPFSTRNGTYLNGKQLEPEKEIMLTKGDKIQLGFRGIELEYQTPN